MSSLLSVLQTDNLFMHPGACLESLPACIITYVERDEIRQKMRRFYLTSDTYKGFLDRHDAEYLSSYISLVNKFANQNASILEVGCGNGLSARLLADHGHRVIGTDLSPFFLRESAHWVNADLSYVCCDALELPFRDDSFDVVCSNDVVEHLVDPEVALDEMTRVLAPGGRLIIVSPNLCSPFLPVLDMIRLIRGRSGSAVWASSVREAIILSLRNAVLSTKKKFSRRPEFIFRAPDLEVKVVGGDSDSSYLASPIDIEKHLKLRGLRIEKRAVGTGIAGKVMSRLMPRYWLHISIVARKQGGVS